MEKTTTESLDKETFDVGSIGVASGTVWHYLQESPKPLVGFGKIQKSTGLSRRMVHAALGWLAREDKVFFSVESRTTKVGLK